MPATAAPSVLYVSADLTVMEVGADELLLGLAQEITQRDEGDVLRAYRRLDLDWYRWLYHAMQRAKKSTTEGRIPAASWDTMCRRFRIVWHWLRTEHTAEEITQAEASYPDARYLPPLARDARAYLALFASPALMTREDQLTGINH